MIKMGKSMSKKEVEKVKNPKKILGKIWKYLSRSKEKLYIGVVLVTMATSLHLLIPYLMAKSIDEYIIPKKSDGLLELLILMCMIQLVIELFNYTQARIMLVISQGTVGKMREDLFSKYQTLPIGYFDKRKKGDLMSRITNDIENISNTLSQSVSEVIRSIISISGALIFMFLLNWQLSMVTILTVPMVIIIGKLLGKYTKKYFGVYLGKLGSVNGIIEEDITGLKTIKAYGQEKARLKIFVEKNKEMREYGIKAQVVSGLMGPSMNLVNNLRFTVVVAFGAWFSLHGLVTIGIITSFINYSRQFGRPISNLAQLYNNIQSALAGAERLFEVLDEESEYINEGIKLEEVEGKVIFENVVFSYEEGKEVLKGISFEGNKGESIALVGPTGAGKTTIINLISKFYSIDSGKIEIDGINIDEIEKNSLRKRLGVVLQDTYLFSGSVRENIRFGRLEASDEEIEWVCKMANAHDFIERLPYGYETELSEDGGNLSEGQRQLLAIARAILANHDILILDEATSNVDTRTEKYIQDALLKLMKGKTSFIIAHRLSTIKEADKIIVINGGKVQEEGNHKELFEKKGFYYDLYMSQFKDKKFI